MNADPTNTQSPHLDLDDLIAEANGVSIGEAAREHLAGCGQCRLEVSRWNLVADGVRGLAAVAAETAAPTSEAGATSGAGAGPQRIRRRVPARLARRGLLVGGSVAAALVLLVGIGVGTGLM